MSIVLQGSTSGRVTLQEPAVAGTTVLTLPAVSGTVLTDTSPKAGNVIQVVNATTSTQTSTNSATYADTTLTASITPTSSSSKILVLVHQNGLRKGLQSADNSMGLRLYRGSTNISQIALDSFYTGTAINIQGQTLSTSYLDSPATTSSTTYKTQFANTSGSPQNVFCQQDSTVSTITLMEIAV
jgi:hypothetical protein